MPYELLTNQNLGGKTKQEYTKTTGRETKFLGKRNRNLEQQSLDHVG